MLGEKRTLSTLKYNKCAFLFLRLCLFSLYFTFLPFYNPPPTPTPLLFLSCSLSHSVYKSHGISGRFVYSVGLRETQMITKCVRGED